MKAWGHRLEKIIRKDANSFRIRVKFREGLVGDISLKSVFEKPKGLAVEILKGGMFDHCFVESGALAWPNGFELCPDTLWRWLKEERSEDQKAA